MNKNVHISQDILGTEIDGESILLDMETENYFGFDSVGSEIWRLLKEGKTLKETYDTLLDLYDVEPEILQQDLLEFVDKLVEHGLASLG